MTIKEINEQISAIIKLLTSQAEDLESIRDRLDRLEDPKKRKEHERKEVVRAIKEELGIKDLPSVTVEAKQAYYPGGMDIEIKDPEEQIGSEVAMQTEKTARDTLKKLISTTIPTVYYSSKKEEKK